MALDHDGALFLLAFDQRDGFADTIGLTAGRDDRIVEAKQVVHDATVAVHARGLAAGHRLGVVVDERFGADVAADAARRGLLLAMPAHRDDRDEFDLAYGDDFGVHIDRFDPAIVTVRLGWNPGLSPEVKKTQARRLAALSAWLHEVGRRLLVDLAVPATRHDLDAVADDPARFRREQRPELLRRSVQELRDLGIEPDLWQLPGGDVDPREDAALVELLRDEGREHVVALAGDRDGGDTDAWLRRAGGTPGFGGFVVGPSVWTAPLTDLVAGDRSRDDAVAAIRDGLTRCIDTYTAARSA